MLAVMIVLILGIAAALLVIREAEKHAPPDLRPHGGPHPTPERAAPTVIPATPQAGSAPVPAAPVAPGPITTIAPAPVALRGRDGEPDDGFERRPVYLEPPDPAVVGFDRPHLRPDPERLIQTEVIVRPRRASRVLALGRLIASTAVVGALVGAGLVLAGRSVVSLVSRFAG